MEGAAIPAMLANIGTALSEVISWIGQVLTAITGTDGALKDLFPILAVGIGVSIVMMVVKVIKRFAWGA